MMTNITITVALAQSQDAQLPRPEARRREATAAVHARDLVSSCSIIVTSSVTPSSSYYQCHTIDCRRIIVTSSVILHYYMISYHTAVYHGTGQ